MAQPKEKPFSCGEGTFIKPSPPREKLNPETEVLNILLLFDEALKLNLAIDECIRKINRLNRSYSEGKRSVVNLAIHLNSNRITVNQEMLPKKGTPIRCPLFA